MTEEIMKEKLQEIVANPVAMARLKEAQRRAKETKDYLRKAGTLPPNWREQRFTI